MRLEALYDLQVELNRLFVAGSRFAKNDPRLKKQQVVFEKLGEKAPVFKKIAADIDELCRCKEKESSEKLTALNQLLYAVLYTQGDSVEEGKEISAQIPYLDYTKTGVDISYRKLSAIINIFTGTGWERILKLEKALNDGSINNYNLFRYIDKALGDKLLAEFISEKILPAIALLMLPFLLESFEYKNTVQEQRRLRAIIALNPPQLSEITDKIVKAKIPLLTAELIKQWPKTAENEELFFSFAKAKNKIVHAEAELALGKLNTKAAWDYLVNQFLSEEKGVNHENLSDALSSKHLPLEYLPELIKKTKELLDELLSALPVTRQNEDKTTELFYKLFLYTKTFLGKESAEAAILLRDILTNASICKLRYAASNFYFFSNFDELFVNITNVLIYNKMSDCLDEQIESNDLSKELKEIIIKAKFKNYTQNPDISPKVIYNDFSKYYKKGIIHSTDLYFEIYKRIPQGAAITDYFDKNWLIIFEELIKKYGKTGIYNLEMYAHLEGINSPKVHALLLRLLNESYEIDTVSQLLVLTNYPDKFDAIFQAMEKNEEALSSVYFKFLDNFGFSQFPKEYAEKFRALKSLRRKNVFNHIADIIENGYY